MNASSLSAEPSGEATRAEMMIIAAARALSNEDVCFVGIGAPSSACNLARLTHAPNIVLIYESGTIGAQPSVLPLSIGDGELCDTALTTVSSAEIFRYWLQGGRITVGFLGGAQIDRFANLNTTVIGTYDSPAVRLPGGGGAPEIAANCGRVFITMALTRRAFVEELPFVTSLGHGRGGDHRKRLGLKSAGPTKVITDMCVLEPEPQSKELIVTTIHPHVSRDELNNACGWPLRFAPDVAETPSATEEELAVLRQLQERTRLAHSVRHA